MTPFALDRAVLLSVALIISCAPCVHSQSKLTLRPLRASVDFSRNCSANAWMGDVTYGSREVRYRAIIAPDFDVDGAVLAWDVGLFDVNDLNKNLLEPSGHWHGIQAFNIVAASFAEGHVRSKYDMNRKIEVKRAGVLCVITVHRAEVSSNTNGTFVFDRLALSIEIIPVDSK